jgi:ribosomal protein S18 acetylase RimI-like enzyme
VRQTQPEKGADRGFRVTPASSADAGRISDFVAGLSVRTQFLRFFASVARPSSSLLRALTGARGRADVLIATDSDGTVIGHGMAADRTADNGSHVSDLGLVVADGWQGRGVGSALMTALTERAAGRGTDELIMDVLPANTRMLAIAGRHWPDARREYNADSVTIRAQLRSQPALTA